MILLLFSSPKFYDQAISDYTKALKINPRYVDVYNTRGNIYAKKGLYDKAISEYKKRNNYPLVSRVI